MDYELMGGDAREAVIAEDKKRNIPVNRRRRFRLARINGRRWSRRDRAPRASRDLP